jgi:hypothetical protein
MPELTEQQGQGQVDSQVQRDLGRYRHESLGQSLLWGIAPCEGSLSNLWCRELRSLLRIVERQRGA